MEEIGIKDYKLITMPFPPRVHYKKFLEKNMLGTIPYFEDENNCMTESSAICLYLVEKFAPTSLQVKPDEPDFSSYLNWIHHADATLTFPQTVLLRYTLQQVTQNHNISIPSSN
jgi:glutathione S-transferase